LGKFLVCWVLKRYQARESGEPDTGGEMSGVAERWGRHLRRYIRRARVVGYTSGVNSGDFESLGRCLLNVLYRTY
jgi:hypothetical protein